MRVVNGRGRVMAEMRPSTDEFGWSRRNAFVQPLVDAALAEGPDAVMLLRIQAERMHDAFFPHTREYARMWGLTEARLRALPESTSIMHPGPMNRGLEIASAAADSPRSTVLEQVANGVSVRMAALYLLCSGVKEGR